MSTGNRPVFKIILKNKSTGENKQLAAVFRNDEPGRPPYSVALSKESNKFNITPEDAGLTGLADYYVNFYEVEAPKEKVPF